MKTKKVLIVGPEFLPIPNICGGAVETLITDFLEFASSSNNCDYEITVYSPYNEKINEIVLKNYRNVKFRYIKKNNLIYKFRKIFLAFIRRLLNKKVICSSYDYEVLKNIKRRNEQNNFDLIILENGMRATRIMKKNMSGEVVLHLHNDKINKNVKNSRDIIKYCDEIWVVSDFLKRRVNEVNNNNKKIKVLYNGVNLNNFSTNLNKSDLNNFAKKYNINSDSFNIIYSGRLMPEKGVLELTKAFNRFLREVPEANIKLFIAGFPDGKDAKKYYKRLVNEKNDNIIFLGKLDYSEMPFLYGLSDVQVVPSIVNEAFGMILIEGLAEGLTIIATNSGGIPELINNENGIIIERNNIEENLYKSLKKVYYDDEFRRKIKKEGPKIARKFSKEKYCIKFTEYIEKIIE